MFDILTYDTVINRGHRVLLLQCIDCYSTKLWFQSSHC